MWSIVNWFRFHRNGVSSSREDINENQNVFTPVIRFTKLIHHYDIYLNSLSWTKCCDMPVSMLLHSEYLCDWLVINKIFNIWITCIVMFFNFLFFQNLFNEYRIKVVQLHTVSIIYLIALPFYVDYDTVRDWVRLRKTWIN